MRRPAGKKPLDPEKVGDPKSAHAFAIAYLARRDFSAADLRRKLKDRGFAESAIEPVLAELEASNVVNDDRYGDNVVAYRARRGQGPARIRQELKRSGLGSEAIQTTMDKAKDDGPDFVSLAQGRQGPKIRARAPQRLERTLAAGQIFAIPGLFNGSYPRCFGGGPGRRVGADPGGEPDPT